MGELHKWGRRNKLELKAAWAVVVSLFHDVLPPNARTGVLSTGVNCIDDLVRSNTVLTFMQRVRLVVRLGTRADCGSGCAYVCGMQALINSLPSSLTPLGVAVIDARMTDAMAAIGLNMRDMVARVGRPPKKLRGSAAKAHAAAVARQALKKQLEQQQAALREASAAIMLTIASSAPVNTPAVTVACAAVEAPITTAAPGVSGLHPAVQPSASAAAQVESLPTSEPASCAPTASASAAKEAESENRVCTCASHGDASSDDEHTDSTQSEGASDSNSSDDDDDDEHDNAALDTMTTLPSGTSPTASTATGASPAGSSPAPATGPL